MLFCGLFCGCEGFCHSTESDLFLFLIKENYSTKVERLLVYFFLIVIEISGLLVASQI